MRSSRPRNRIFVLSSRACRGGLTRRYGFKVKKLIIGFILFIVIFYGYQYITRPIKGEADNLRPYLENCLDLIIRKAYPEVYDQYFKEKQITACEFNNRMKYLSVIFGEPTSYEYFRSYIGGVSYFIQYHMIFSNNKKYTCSFGFPITEGKEIIEKEDLQRLSISGDFGEREFEIQFDNGRVLGHKTPDIRVGYPKGNWGSKPK